MLEAIKFWFSLPSKKNLLWSKSKKMIDLQESNSTLISKNKWQHWETLLDAFLNCHQNPYNQALHLISTPLGLWAILSLISFWSSYATITIATLYVISLWGKLPIRIWIVTTVASAILVYLAISIQPFLAIALLALPISYGLQEAAHLLTGEVTYQSTYMDKGNWLWQFFEHNYYLLPLVLAPIAITNFSLLSWFVARDTVMDTKLKLTHDLQDLDTIRDWVEQQQPPTTHSTHWWIDQVPQPIKDACDRIARSFAIAQMFHRIYKDNFYTVEVIEGMNEIYVTGPPQEFTSDKVFYLAHVDAPFFSVYPFAAVFRCMVAVNPNDWVHTHFPLQKTSFEDPGTYTLTTGDVLAFDYLRELHYITATANDNEEQPLRINLKLHYLIYPTWLRPYGKMLGKLADWYNMQGRKTFLMTLAPDSISAKISAALLLGWTKVVEFTHRFMGATNLVYTLLLAICSLLLKNGAIFLAGTSFVHYLIYIATFFYRSNVSYGTFLRNVVFFKSLAMCQLLFWYIYYFQFEPISFGFVVVGYALSFLAYFRLGSLRTYFGVELGKIAPQKIDAFPYGVIPHPMIVGNIIGLIGLEMLEPLRVALPWLVPLHLAFYLVHLGQEIFDFHEHTSASVTENN